MTKTMVTMMKMATNVMALQMEAAHKEDMVGWSPKNQQQMQLGGWVGGGKWRMVENCEEKSPPLDCQADSINRGVLGIFLTPAEKLWCLKVLGKSEIVSYEST